MLGIDVMRVQRMVSELQECLRGGLVATDVWERETGTVLASYAHQPAACELFGRLTVDLVAALRGAGFPQLNRYFMLDMEGNSSVVVILHDDDVLQGLLLNTERTNMGTMLSLGLRTAFEGVRAARR